MALLTDTELLDALSGLPGWHVRAGALEKDYRGEDFMWAVGFVNRIAERAEAAGHHPDLSLGWGTVTVRLVTHSENGITRADTDLAATIDGVA